MASDFSLPPFRFLERLLIVHGHWCYKRISKMILYFVYKNVVFGLTLLYYEICTSFSGEVLYDDWYMLMFNVLLKSLSVISCVFWSRMFHQTYAFSVLIPAGNMHMKK